MTSVSFFPLDQAGKSRKCYRIIMSSDVVHERRQHGYDMQVFQSQFSGYNRLLKTSVAVQVFSRQTTLGTEVLNPSANRQTSRMLLL